jgi:hypothetical protein
MRKLVRLSVAIGGFLIMASLILSGTVFLALLNVIDAGVFADQTGFSLLALVFLAIGVADFIAGILLLKRQR